MNYAYTLAFVVALILSFNNTAFASDKVRVSYSGTTAIVDYSGVIDAGVNVTRIRYYKCADQIRYIGPDESCDRGGQATIVEPTADHKIEIKDIGLFNFELWRAIPQVMGNDYRTVVAWRMFVVNLYKPDLQLQAAIKAHAPLYSFYKNENYFPVTINDIYGRPISDFKLRVLPNGNTTAQLSSTRGSNYQTAAEYMRGNGSYGARLKLEKAAAKSISGSENAFPTYWFADKLSDTAVRVHYFVLFGFDEKVPAYVSDNVVGQATLPLLGEHAIDRESVSVTYEKSGAAWQPTNIVYAAHLPNQSMHFMGCSDGPVCDDEMSGEVALTNWNNGATALSWDTASKLRDRPIVYVAHGSHAHFPARGFYDVEHALWGNLVNGEPAGRLDPSDRNFVSSQLTMLDLNNSEHAALTFSGTVIEGATSQYRQFPFVRYPTKNWAAALGNDVQQCVESETVHCEDYMLKPKECYGIGGIENADGLSFSDRDNDGVQDTRDAFPDDASETTDIDNNGLGDNANPPTGFVAVTGQIKDASGIPIAFAHVRLEMYQRQFGKAIAVQTQSDENGYYRLPVDLVNLPESFAITYIAKESLSRVYVIQNRPSTSDHLADIVLDDCEDYIIQIERFPRVHHLGDDVFEGQANSAFQRETEGQQFNYEFILPEKTDTYANFSIKFFAKGVDANNSTFRLNNNQALLIPASPGNSDFLEISFDGTREEYLAPGLNTLSITAGSNGFGFDDFEMVNPVITLF